MKVIKMSTAPAKDLTEDRLMTGGKAAAQFMIGPDTAKELTFGITRFGPGGRTKFHTHTGEQIILGIEGKGIVATEKEQIIVDKDMVVFFPAGEKHWHGATKDSSFAHLTISTPHKTDIVE
jgi:quercetin dioxygenase-like cupin family protein